MVTIGRVTAPHGVRGEVRVLPLTDDPGRFADLKRVHLALGGRTRVVDVEAARPHGRFILVKPAGCDSRDAAEGLRDAELQVEESDVAPLAPEHYYGFQVRGLQVVTTEGEPVGRVTDIIFGVGAANDVYVVRRQGGSRTGGRREVLVPATREVVRRVDVPGGRMVIWAMPGLLDD